MTNQTETTESTQTTREGPTKAAAVNKLLSRAKGATLSEITDATGWKPHSARAFMTGLRKKDIKLVRECRATGETCWRIER